MVEYDGRQTCGQNQHHRATVGPTEDKIGKLRGRSHENGHCRDSWDLDNTNAYSRVKCNNGWCAYMYALYFEKDQAALGPGSAGHRNDWEHVVVPLELGDLPPGKWRSVSREELSRAFGAAAETPSR